tara:strand:+ start:179 stop:478 length:300 start_codon:yes stop_codon:yes gene_type:complete
MEEQVMLDTSTLESMMAELIQSIGRLDLSIDYLSAIMSGEEAAIIGAAQGAYGRAVGTRGLAMPAPEQMAENKRTKKLFNDKITTIIQEEVSKFLKQDK